MYYIFEYRIFLIHSSMRIVSVLTIISGDSGSSYGADIPVKFGIWPDLALLYSPFTSLSSHTLNGAFTNTSINLPGPIMFLALCRSFFRALPGALFFFYPASKNFSWHTQIR